MPPQTTTEPRHYGSISLSQDEETMTVEPRPPAADHSNKEEEALARSSTRSRILFASLGGLLFLLVWYSYSYAREHGGHGVRTGVKDDNSSNNNRFDVERFYPHQKVDHFGTSSSQEDNDKYDHQTYSQRYFEDASFFQGPGHPILVVMGGEDPVEQILYPWVPRSLAQSLGAVTLCIEHRFYGKSQPIAKDVVTNVDFRHLLHPRQALADAAQLIQDYQADLGCGPRGSSTYCPVVTIGGSYPGFLSVLMRTVHNEVVDIGWGSSAPLYLYSHAVVDTAYFDKITSVAEAYSPGCTQAVRTTLQDLKATLLASGRTVAQEASDMGVCVDTIPEYIDSLDLLQQEIIMIVAAHFAENNMGFYPPGPDQALVQGCEILQQDDTTHKKIQTFLQMHINEPCFDLVTELPPGPDGTITASDWSGTGGGHSGYMWDYQSCTLIPECSLSAESMFPPRKWTLDWLTDHCQRRFDMTPHPNALVEEFGFDDLSNDSRIIFTNGYNDGWYVLSITEDVSDTIRTFNLPNGAHHSDLTHVGATDQDTPDIVEGHKQVTALLQSWLKEIMSPRNSR